jgi:hypothetical protein
MRRNATTIHHIIQHALTHFPSSSFIPSSRMTSLQQQILESFSAAQHANMNLATCDHCGISCSGGELYCDCADLIEAYGAVKCSCCSAEYGFCVDVLDYILTRYEEGGYTYEDAEYDAYDYYYDMVFVKAMPTPCADCSSVYKSDRDLLLKTYDKWLKDYLRRFPPENPYEWGYVYDCRD